MAAGETEFRVLGRVEVLVDGAPASVGGPRQETLLALLLNARGHAVPADVLIDELWSGEPPSGADKTLRSYVSRLRSALGQSAQIESAASGYVLVVATSLVDAFRFEADFKEARNLLARGALRRARDRATAALRAWRGEPFLGIADDGKLRVEADRLTEMRVDALELRFDAELRLGAAGSIVDELRSVVAAHPYRETLWRQLMLALYRAGRQAEALDAYREARRKLSAELGIDPSAELEHLQRSILRHEVPAAEAAHRIASLPIPDTTFIGRTTEIAELRALLGKERLVTLTGVGGVGKTRLALEAATAVASDFSDGAVLVDLGSIIDPGAVSMQVARLLDVPEPGSGLTSDGLARALRDRDLLIVLDNCEHVLAPVTSLVAQILTLAPDVRFLATSREPLKLPAEADYPVSPMALPVAGSDVRQIASSDAVRLLIERVRAISGRASLDESDVLTAARICADLEGLPLAIELAAARAKALSLEDIAARLNNRFAFLVSWRRLSVARHRTLREAMDWSYDLLAEDTRSRFLQLSVFVGGFDIRSVAAVSTRGEEDVALELIERLVDASLVFADTTRYPTRYRLLETVRQYAAERLGEAMNEARQRHAQHFLALAAEKQREVEEVGRLTPLTELDPDQGNLRAAIEWFKSTNQAECSVRMASALWRFWWLRGMLSEGRRHVTDALAGTPDDLSAARSDALRGASSLSLRQGDIIAAVEFATESERVAWQLQDLLAVARAQVALANAVSSNNEFERAEQLYESSAAGFRTLGQRWELGNVLLNSADLALNREQFAAAEKLATESLGIAREVRDDSGIAVNLGNIAFAALEQGDFVRARFLFQDALRHSRELDFTEWIAIMISGVAAADVAAGKFDTAAILLASAARIRGDIGVMSDSIERKVETRTREVVSSTLEPGRLAAASAEGERMSIDDAIELALDGAAGRAADARATKTQPASTNVTTWDRSP